VHVDPDAQLVHPVYPLPPHWPYLATEQEAGVEVVAALLVVLVLVVAALVEVVSVVAGGWAVVVGVEPPPLAPQVKTAGPGMV
jgi:hypothetical protein